MHSFQKRRVESPERFKSNMFESVILCPDSLYSSISSLIQRYSSIFVQYRSLVSYLYTLEAIPDEVSKLRVLAADDCVSRCSGQMAGPVVVNRRSGVILAQQLIVLLFGI